MSSLPTCATWWRALALNWTVLMVAIIFFKHPAIPGLINLQEVRGEGKPYQIRQFLRLVERYNLRLED